jgi:type III pantothenate kinase
MILAIDVGNTSITVGIYQNDSLVDTFRMPSDIGLTFGDYERLISANVGDADVRGAIIGSVVDELNDRLSYAVLELYKVKPVLLSYSSNLPIKLRLKNNSEIGADRIANGVRAYNLYKKAVIVVDFGTATTFDIVNSSGEFVGGIIAPGINTQFESLNKSTSKLPKLDVEYIEKSIGDSTIDAILSGVVRGTACMVEGMLRECEAELSESAVVVATGGLSGIVEKYMTRKFDVVDMNLTLDGLRDLYKLNSRAKIF